MGKLLYLCAGLILIVIQSLIGAKAFFPGAFVPADPVDAIVEAKKPILDKLPPEDLAWLARHPTARVGVDPNFYPIEMFDERGRYTGLAADYQRLLAKMTGIDFQPVALADWSATESAAARGGIDVFLAAASTGKRAEFMRFTPLMSLCPE